MHLNKRTVFTLAFSGLLVCLSACGKRDSLIPTSAPLATPTQGASGWTPTALIEVPPATETPVPLKRLTICLGREPRSLFLYDAGTASALSVLAAIYDGPVDLVAYQPQPVILVKIPTQADGDSLRTPVTVQPGELIVDASGELVTLQEGVIYRPSGCRGAGCEQVYSGAQPVEMDQWTLRFQLLPGLQWSDGVLLTADDSLYAFEVAQALYPAALPGLVSKLVDRTAAYRVLDAQTVEWSGVPGYQDGLVFSKFFSPLPRHAWGGLAPAELPTAEIASRKPLGWGPYVIEAWESGEQITLRKNPRYFRAREGLPYFDLLQFRFMADPQEAVDALLIGACDWIDSATAPGWSEALDERLLELREAGRLELFFRPAVAWELALWNIAPLDAEQAPRNAFFSSREVRQALALCVDRQALVERIPAEAALVADSYVSPLHPLWNAEAARYPFDPSEGSRRLQELGWLDADGDPGTPRLAAGVPGVPDGTPFTVTYLVAPDPEMQSAAQIVQASLAQCGVRLDLVSQPFAEYLAPGPEGPVFGRRFDLAQVAWPAALEPSCELYLGSEIPGPYPGQPRGWGGANASGYSNPAYDQACRQALYTLPDDPEHAAAHRQAQAIFAQDLPALPLYWRFHIVIARPGFCEIATEPAANILQNLEKFTADENCLP